MRRYTQMLVNARQAFGPVHPQKLALDIGSCTTKIISGQQALFLIPTCVAQQQITKTVVAIGQEAAEMIGKTPPGVETLFPIRRGKITDVGAAQYFVKAVIEKKLRLNQGLLTPLLLRHAQLAFSPSHSSIQREFLQRLVQGSGFSQVQMVNKNTALLHHLRQSKYVSPILCTIDMGGMTTEVCLFAQEELVVQKTLNLGGEDFTQEIMRAIRKAHQCEVGWQTAEKIKQTVGRVGQSQDHPKLLVIRGPDTVTSLPKTVQVSAMDFDNAFLHLAEDIYGGIRELCQDAPSELITTALDQGIFLTGGGSLLHGMDEFLMKKLQCQVHRSTTPFEDVIRGLIL